MKPVTLIATAAMAATLGTAAFGQQLRASDTQSLVDFFTEEGYRPSLTTDQVGDPMIEFRHEGDTQYLLFYDCTEHEDCLAVQFYAGYQLDNPVPLETLNQWNGGESRRFTRAFLTESGMVGIEMDIATSKDGISSRDFKDLVSLWLQRQGEFESLIGF